MKNMNVLLLFIEYPLNWMFELFSRHSKYTNEIKKKKLEYIIFNWMFVETGTSNVYYIIIIVCVECSSRDMILLWLKK